MLTIYADPIGTSIGARVSGIDLAKMTTAGDDALRRALHQHKVLVFPEQALKAEQLAMLGRRFGDTYLNFGKEAPSYCGAEASFPDVNRIEFGSTDADNQLQKDVACWHIDHCYTSRPTQYTFLQAEEVPLAGGQTLFTDTAAAFAALSPPLQELLQGMTCIQNMANGYPSRSDDMAEVMRRNPPKRTPVVYEHPDTKANCLSVNQAYTTRICEMTQLESDAILAFLKNHVARPEFVIEYRWKAGDLVMFDNLACQHYVAANYWPHRRVMMQLSVLGPGELQPASRASALLARVVPRGPKPSALPDAELRRDLAAGLRLLHRQQQSDMAAGFFVARSASDPSRFYATPHGTFWSEATPEHFTAYSCATGSPLEPNRGLPNSPVCPIASAVFSAYPDIQAIIHAHGRQSMALAAASADDNPILPISEPSFMFYERVKSLKCDFFFGPEYVAEIVLALAPPTFALQLRNHAYLMTGRSLQECYLRAYMFEQAAGVQLQAMQVGPPQVPGLDEIKYHRSSYEGFPGCPPYDGQLEWAGLLRSLAAEGLEWCGGGEASSMQMLRSSL